MKGIFLKLLLIITTMFATSLMADEHKHGSWLGTFTKKKMTQNFDLWAETQLRYNWDMAGVGQILYRVGVLQKLTDYQGLGYLYAYIKSDNIKEHRYTVQHTFNYFYVEGLKLSHRVRLEARVLENSSDDAMRARLLVKLEDDFIGQWSWMSYNEIFVNLSDDVWTGERTFERNRFYLGVKKPYEEFTLNIGYVNQYVPRATQDTYEHNLYLGFNF